MEYSKGYKIEKTISAAKKICAAVNTIFTVIDWIVSVETHGVVNNVIEFLHDGHSYKYQFSINIDIVEAPDFEDVIKHRAIWAVKNIAADVLKNAEKKPFETKPRKLISNKHE